MSRVDVTRPRSRARAVLAGILFPIFATFLTAVIGKTVGTLLGMTGGPPAWFGPFAVATFVAGPLFAAIAHRRATKKNVELEVEADTLVIGDRRIPRSKIASGFVVHNITHASVELELDDGEQLSIKTDSVEADAILDRLELGAKKRRARVQLTNAAERVMVAFGTGVIGMIAIIMLFGLATTIVPKALLAAAMASIFWAPISTVVVGAAAVAGGVTGLRSLPEIEIGIDGVSIPKPGIGKRPREFTSFDDVDRVEIVSFGTYRLKASRIELVHKGGGRTPVATLGAGKEAQAQAIVDRIQAALKVFQQGGGAELSAMLERGSTPVATWLESLRALARSGGGYRATALEDDRLLEIVSDPKAPLDVRVGAAVVVSERGDKDGRERVRVAAEAAASPRLRIALDGVAGGSTDEAALAEALEAEAEAESATAESEARS
ncbi:MAG: hypothetical protein HOV80_06550 [Polyangiaceae bacterium]|nr:hypothetical protein [Polyangiaceae bacterium]